MDILTIAKIAYILTNIPAAYIVAKANNPFVTLVMLGYSTMALLYFLDIQYHAAFGYGAWAIINFSLFAMILKKGK